MIKTTTETWLREARMGFQMGITGKDLADPLVKDPTDKPGGPISVPIPNLPVLAHTPLPDAKLDEAGFHIRDNSTAIASTLRLVLAMPNDQRPSNWPECPCKEEPTAGNCYGTIEKIEQALPWASPVWLRGARDPGQQDVIWIDSTSFFGEGDAAGNPDNNFLLKEELALMVPADVTWIAISVWISEGEQLSPEYEVCRVDEVLVMVLCERMQDGLKPRFQAVGKGATFKAAWSAIDWAAMKM